MLLLLIALLFDLSHGSHLPDDLKLCHKSDPNFRQCVCDTINPGIRSFANGNEYYAIPVLEPFFVKELALKGNTGGSVSIEHTYRNANVTGLINLECKEYTTIDFEVNNCGYVFQLFSPIVRVEADYELTGKLLVFPLNAHGKSNITLHNVWNSHYLDCEVYTVNNKTYIKAKNYSIDLKPEKVVFQYENIFPENEMISREIMKTINENSQIVFEDVRKSFEQIISNIYATLWNNLFSRTPSNKIFLD